MKRLLPILLLCGCTGSLVDHQTASSGGDTGITCDAGKFKCGLVCCSATELSAGTSHSCAVTDHGEARCWGANDVGQLGRDLSPASSSFVAVAPSGLPGPVSHVAAGSAHTCAIVEGNVWCWGANDAGQLGNGSTGAGTATPAQVGGISAVQLIAAGGSHTCAATASKTYCWGSDTSGEVGDGSFVATRSQPTEVPGAAGATALAAGQSHTCAITTSGVLCWGNDDFGQLGNGTTGSPVASPGSPFLSTNGASFLALGANHGCAVADTDKLWCWGANAAFQIDNSGQIQPVPNTVLSGARSVAAGASHTCAITTGATLTCWGLNDESQLTGTGSGRNGVDTPLSAVQSVAAGYKHTCAIAGGTTYCWGLNDRGQAGGPTSGAIVAPNPVANH